MVHGCCIARAVPARDEMLVFNRAKEVLLESDLKALRMLYLQHPVILDISNEIMSSTIASQSSGNRCTNKF